MELEPGLLRRLLDATRAAIVATDADGRVIYWSHAAQELYGYTSAEVAGRRLRDILVTAEHTGPAAEIAMKVSAGQTWTGSFPVRHRNGTMMMVQVTNSPIFDDDGRVAGIVGVSLDISDRVRADERFRREQELLRSTIDGAPLVLFATDLDGVFTVSRGRGLQALGLREDEVLGRSALDLYGAAPTSVDGKPMTFADAFERVRRGESIEAHVVAGAVHFDVWLRPARDPAALITGIVGVALDVTSRTELELRLQQAERLEALGLLAGGVAHDFNNMLTAILGHAEILAVDLKEDRLRGDLEAIQHAAESAAAVTRQLLAFTRRQRQELRPIDINESVRSLEQLLRRTVGERIALELDLGPQPATVIADPVQIEQVILNLALNARDSMPDGGRLRISTATASEAGGPGDSHIVLVVSDTGHGMSAATRARIFEPFFTTKERGRGTGLGLASVHGIVTQTGGRILVDSREGAGSSFRVLLPRVSPRAARPAVEDHPPSRDRSAKTRILLVEDEDNVRSLIARMLDRAGYDVTAHAGGVAALEAVCARPDGFDLVLTDVIMPGMSGAELARQIAAIRPTVPIVFMSGYAEATPGRTEQPDLQKPFTRAELLDCLARRLNQ